VAQSDYATLKLFFNSNPLQKLTSIRHRTESGQQPVELLNEGLSGFTPGAGRCTVEVGYVIPVGGPEENFQAQCKRGSYVDLQLFMGSLVYAGRGKITETEIGQSNSETVTGSFTWIGEFAEFE
jgi:hypothetical protein